MSDIILRQGDKVIFDANTFQPAKISVKPGSLEATSKTTIKGKKICFVNDAYKVQVMNCAYEIPGFQGGMGTLSIFMVDPSQISKTAKSGRKPVLLKGAQFTAMFQKTKPAQSPQGVPDPAPFYMGKGHFEPSFDQVKGK